VAGLVLMDTRAEGDSAEARKGRDEMAALVAREGMAPVAQRLVPRLLARGSRRAAVRHLKRMILGAPRRGVIAALAAMRDRADASARLSRIAVPTLVVVGAEDQLTPPEVVVTMAARIRGARSAIVPGAGHVPAVERPHVTTELLRRFLRQIV